MLLISHKSVMTYADNIFKETLNFKVDDRKKEETQKNMEKTE